MSRVSANLKEARGKMANVIERINPVLRGWAGYFKLSQNKRPLEGLDGWGRHKLHCGIGRQVSVCCPGVIPGVCQTLPCAPAASRHRAGSRTDRPAAASRHYRPASDIAGQPHHGADHHKQRQGKKRPRTGARHAASSSRWYAKPGAINCRAVL